MVRSGIEAPVGNYGQDWKAGVLSEHLRPAHSARRLPGGTWIVIQPDGSTNKIVCSELIWVFTEDGRIDGRCGLPVDEHGLTCPRHELPTAENYRSEDVPLGYDI
jgi:hypothetical protein